MEKESIRAISIEQKEEVMREDESDLARTITFDCELKSPG